MVCATTAAEFVPWLIPGGFSLVDPSHLCALFDLQNGS